MWLWLGLVSVFLVTQQQKIVEIVDKVMNKDDGLKEITKAAEPISKETGMPLSIIVTQAVHESNYGMSGLAQKSKNLFGIKAGTSWIGKRDNYPTIEYVNGKPVTVDAYFRSYASWTDSVRDWASLIRKNYPAAWALGMANHPEAFFQAIKDGGYATDPTYAQKLSNVFAAISKKVEALA